MITPSHLRPARRVSLAAVVLNAMAAFGLVSAATISRAAESAPATTKAQPATKQAETVTKEVELTKWSGAINVPDPVSVAVDPQGRVYVTATTRRKVADLDIREFTNWIPNDVALASVDDKSAFYRDVLAPGKMRQPKGSLADHNKDGSIDWKDLTVHTERIYQMRDTDGDGVADKMTVFAEGFNTDVTGIAAGVMYHDGWVYATIAPDLWRFKDTDDDGVADIREIVVHGFGIHIAYAGHDMHGLSVGPDGRIYWSIGDKGVNVTSKEGKKFVYSNEGCVMRVESDGTGFEVYAHGVRNPQEPAFDDYGDLFDVDNDADQRGERERFVRILEGSDSGWRCNFQYMAMESPWMREGLWKPAFEGQPAYFLPPLLSYSDGPAGFRHDPGTALSDKQRGMFFLNEFPSGKLRAFRAERDGASFKMVDARILNSGIMGIGFSWHPDGSLFLADWIGGYPLDGLGAVWRVDVPGAAKNPARVETHALLKAGFEKSSEAELVTRLAHADQRVRQGAQLELAKRNRGEVLLGVATEPKAAQLARIHAIWGYGQLLRRGAADAAKLLPLLADADHELRAQAAKVLGDAPKATGASAARLIPLLADESPRVRLQTAIALGKLAVPAAVDALLALAEKEGADPVMRSAIVTGLTGCASAEKLAAQNVHPSIAVRVASVIALRRQAAPAVQQFLADQNLAVVDEAAHAIHDDLSIPAALPALAALASKPIKGDPLVRRALNANLRLGTPEAAGRLLAFALDEAHEKEMRQEALISLRVWNAPYSLDRVDGRARKFNSQPVAAVLEPKLDALLALTDPALKTLAIEIMIAHSLRAAAPQIAGIVGDAKASGALRAQALRLLAGQHKGSPVLAATLDQALTAESPAALHMAALELLLPDRPDKLAAEAATTLASRPVPEKQHALAQLAAAATPAADAVLEQQGAQLVAGKCPPALQLDVAEALRVRGAARPALAAQLKAFTARAEAPAQGELLEGGSAAAGAKIVSDHLAANCMACHSLTASGGSEVGPNLRTVGQRNDRAYLLESLLNPAAKIAVGYGMVGLTLKDTSAVTGTLAKETDTEVTVRLFDGTMRKVARADIVNQTPPVSIMPPMGAILQPREIRDVVAYLSSLKGGRPAANPEEH